MFRVAFAIGRSKMFRYMKSHAFLSISQAACVLMWGPSLIERLLAKWDIIHPKLVASVFLFLLGHTHNLLRSILHAVFAQQIHGITWQGNQLELHQRQASNGRARLRWRSPGGSNRDGGGGSSNNRVEPSVDNNQQQQQQQQQRPRRTRRKGSREIGAASTASEAAPPPRVTVEEAEEVAETLSL